MVANKLPFAVFRRKSSSEAFRGGVAIGDQVLDMAAVRDAKALGGDVPAELKARKVATLEARRPQVIAAGNIGCMIQIGSGTAVPVVHTVELLDWATGGPKPRALADLP